MNTFDGCHDGVKYYLTGQINVAGSDLGIRIRGSANVKIGSNCRFGV